LIFLSHLFAKTATNLSETKCPHSRLLSEWLQKTCFWQTGILSLLSVVAKAQKHKLIYGLGACQMAQEPVSGKSPF
jgi:hypothetical protein